ncbi:hypothetical protein G6O69_32425 [Pseudenhygromyxa sp. WMMC2535]|uniref:hypothetical protein n=1 Tax=Pseudenhygromyxa sp. WMMC2535 TaxID=2712867 RepID=UPI001557CAE8|nr:hypothetical protein [Pseudenhygromyxa sp. WMMC2535]NVB42575.1 hypothetical protein [Pseudenhygromyxa sp. WMMC2535]
MPAATFARATHMFSYQLYNLLHVLGIILVFMAFGGWAFHGISGGTKETNKARALLAATHGVGILLIIIAGFGMLARVRSMQAGLPGWLHPKLFIWVLFAAAPAVFNRKPEWSKALWFLFPLLAAVSAYFAINHPGESGAAAPAASDEAAQTEAE